IGVGQAAYQAQKLYYSSIPSAFLKLMLFTMRLRGLDVTRMGTNKDIDFTKIIDNIEPTHANVPIADYLEKWDEASTCHKSQGGGTGWFGRFPMWLRRIIQGKQGFTRVYPMPTANRVDEQDLFQNVKVEETLLERV